MILVLKKSMIIRLNIMNSLQCLIPSFQEDFIFISSSFEMVELLLFPKNDLIVSFFIVKIIRSISMFLCHTNCTFVADEASFLIISASLSTFFILFFILFIDCSFNFDFTTNVLRDFFVVTNYLSNSFTWFYLISSVLCRKGWVSMKDLDSLNARFCLLGSVSTILVWKKWQLNFSWVQQYVSLQSWFLWFSFLVRQYSELSVEAE